MKKIFFAAIAIEALCFIITSCAPPKDAISDSVPRNNFVGTWTLNTVTYDGLMPAAVQNVFNQAPPQDFVGSTWQFTNSGNGAYTLVNGPTQNIFWSIYYRDPRGTLFQFKKLYVGDKAQNVKMGYKLIITSNDGTDMVLKTPIALGDKTGYIVYSFSR